MTHTLVACCGSNALAGLHSAWPPVALPAALGLLALLAPLAPLALPVPLAPLALRALRALRALQVPLALLRQAAPLRPAWRRRRHYRCHPPHQLDRLLTLLLPACHREASTPEAVREVHHQIARSEIA